MRVPKTLILDFVKGMWGSNVVPFSYNLCPKKVFLPSFLNGKGCKILIGLVQKALKRSFIQDQPGFCSFLGLEMRAGRKFFQFFLWIPYVILMK